MNDRKDQDRRNKRIPTRDANAEPKSTREPGIGATATSGEIGEILSKSMFGIRSPKPAWADVAKASTNSKPTIMNLFFKFLPPFLMVDF
jgi:hypothetical protein